MDPTPLYNSGGETTPCPTLEGIIHPLYNSERGTTPFPTLGGNSPHPTLREIGHSPTTLQDKPLEASDVSFNINPVDGTVVCVPLTSTNCEKTSKPDDSQHAPDAVFGAMKVCLFIELENASFFIADSKNHDEFKNHKITHTTQKLDQHYDKGREGDF